jgi:hypothetical protein
LLSLDGRPRTPVLNNPTAPSKQTTTNIAQTICAKPFAANRNSTKPSTENAAPALNAIAQRISLCGRSNNKPTPVKQAQPNPAYPACRGNAGPGSGSNEAMNPNTQNNPHANSANAPKPSANMPRTFLQNCAMLIA